jgi:outer membrane biosynthesis protein TonB
MSSDLEQVEAWIDALSRCAFVTVDGRTLSSMSETTHPEPQPEPAEQPEQQPLPEADPTAPEPEPQPDRPDEEQPDPEAEPEG